jgi:hypothetical protein
VSDGKISIHPASYSTVETLFLIQWSTVTSQLLATHCCWEQHWIHKTTMRLSNGDYMIELVKMLDVPRGEHSLCKSVERKDANMRSRFG